MVAESAKDKVEEFNWQKSELKNEKTFVWNFPRNLMQIIFNLWLISTFHCSFFCFNFSQCECLMPRIKKKLVLLCSELKSQWNFSDIFVILGDLLSNSVTLSVLFVKISFYKFFCNVGFLKNLFECFYNCCNLKL